MSRMVLNGFYHDIPVAIALDNSCSHSSLDFSFAFRHQIPQTVSPSSDAVTVSTAQGPFSVPTSNGWYKCVFPLVVQTCGRVQITLGLDWFERCAAVVDSGGLADPTHEWLVDRSVGCSWRPLCSPDCGVDGTSIGTSDVVTLMHGDDRAHGLRLCDSQSVRSTTDNLFDTMTMHPPQPARLDVSGSDSASFPPCIQYAARMLCPSVPSMRLFALSANEQYVRTVAISHGVCSRSIGRTRLRLAIHILSGECVSNVCAPDSFSSGGCAEVVGDYRSGDVFVNDVCRAVLQTADSQLSALVSDLYRVLHLRSYRSRLPVEADTRSHLQLFVRECSLRCSESQCDDSMTEIDSVFSLSLEDLIVECVAHGLRPAAEEDSEHVRTLLAGHLLRGECAIGEGTKCTSSRDRITAPAAYTDDTDWERSAAGMQLGLLVRDLCKMTLPALRRAHEEYQLPYCLTDSHGRLRQNLRQLVVRLRKGKKNAALASWRCQRNDSSVGTSTEQGGENVWPRVVSSDVKNAAVTSFLAETSTATLASFVCFCCGTECRSVDKNVLSIPSAFPVQLLRRSSDLPAVVAMPLSPRPSVAYGILSDDVVVEPAGLRRDVDGLVGDSCPACALDLQRHKLPALSLANRMYVGPVPDELRDLTIVEEALIALCRAKVTILQLNEDRRGRSTSGLGNTQRGMKGHVITFPQDASKVAFVLPPTVEETMTAVCVIFVGSHPPTSEWLAKYAKPLIVRREKVRAALQWLALHNPLYSNVMISASRLEQLPTNGILPVHVETVAPSAGQDTVTGRYEHLDQAETMDASVPDEINFESVVVTDVDGHASSSDLRAAAVRHLKRGGGYVEVSHGSDPSNEYNHPSLFPKLYPTLFPYGIGGFEDPGRRPPVSLQRHVTHLLRLKDTRFQRHHAFQFTVFNILQRREVLLRTSLKMKRGTFDRLASQINPLTPEAVARVTERVSNNDYVTAYSEADRNVLTLMKESKVVSSHVRASAASKVVRRNEIRALMLSLGLPSFFVTINPADVYNPVVKLLAGADIDVDCLSDVDVPTYREQSVTIAENPVVAARFFRLYVDAFVKCLLRYLPDGSDDEGGVLGAVNGYYGCVEAQGRGTLHCHLLVWLGGALNPNELREKILSDDTGVFQRQLFSFLEDTIATSIPDLPIATNSEEHDVEEIDGLGRGVNPCAVRGIPASVPATCIHFARARDLHFLAERCQRHSHSNTCYKHWKGPPEPRTCRFGLDDANTQPISTCDPSTGSISLRSLDGLVNHFNETILRAMRCNMDIKFIGSGDEAKAVLYYITDYITKSQLKTHVAYAALELAVKKLGESDDGVDVSALRAKRLLRKCVFAMLAHQELSAQEVAMHLLQQDDYVTSHHYRSLYWSSFEAYVDRISPSPECRGDLDGQVSAIPEPTPTVTEDDIEVNDDTDDVRIGADENGTVVPLGNQLNDYIFRGDELAAVNLWDFVGRVEKVKLAPNTIRSRGRINVLDDLSRRRPVVPLKDGHPEFGKKGLKVLPAAQARVVVPTGPALPRRDRGNVRSRYSRLMLIFFKPWRTVGDLRAQGEQWGDAWDDYLQESGESIHALTNNMQLLHECKDSRDENLKARRSTGANRCRVPRSNPSLSHEGDMVVEADVPEDVDGILTHLAEVEQARNATTTRLNLNSLACLQSAEDHHLFSESGGASDAHVDAMHEHEIVDDDDLQRHENVWRGVYDTRKKDWKASMRNGPHARSTPDSPPADNPSIARAVIQTVSSALTSQPVPPSLTLRVGRNAEAFGRNAYREIDSIAQSWSLNRAQRRAFRIIARHTVHDRGADDYSPLRMYIGGAGGTGKSRVVNALRSFFSTDSCVRRLHLASYTGVAAKHIHGMTLHALLNLNRSSSSSKTAGAASLNDLREMWDGVDYLFIDEVSMVSCQFLARINAALCDAKGSAQPFGGVSVIFAGDFAQLPPVGETSLTSWIDTSVPATAAKTKGQDKIAGKVLWNSIDKVVILTESMRQSGSGNVRFNQLLTRLRTGQCTFEDYSLLCTRVLQNVAGNTRGGGWDNAPTIVNDNASKDALNTYAVSCYARRTGREMHWYYASDRYKGSAIEDESVLRSLESMHSGQTNQRLSRVPLVIGMRVIVSQNFDVNGGIVNGSVGTLASLRYTTDDSGRRHLRSCVIKVEDDDAPPIPGLDEKHVPVLQDSVAFDVTHPFSKLSCTIQRTQVPIQPAYAITAHRAQGQTLDKVVIDLAGCSGTQAPYVMVSRATSLDGILILRPFGAEKIMCHQSQDVRKEMDRLHRLSLVTTVADGEASERIDAETELSLLSRKRGVAADLEIYTERSKRSRRA